MKQPEAKKIAEDALKDLAAELEKGNSEKLTAFLAAIAHFHNYSWGNTLLISMQRPDATWVAGFTAWKKLSRFVKKGEKGIAIIAPIISRKKAADEASDDDEAPKPVHHFKLVHVFDVAQTDGDPLPEFHTVAGDPGEKLFRLKAFIKEQGIELEYVHLGIGTFGSSSGGRICVKPDLIPAVEFSILVHECGHELLHQGDRRKETTKTVRETEAEAVSFVVCKACGLAGGSTSPDYIKLYQGTAETLAESLEFIQKAAAQIITALDIAA